MAIKNKACFTIRCDGCGAGLDWDYEPHFDSPEMARELARDDDSFWSDGTTDLCGSCKLRPHEFIPELPGRDDVACDRCGLDKDDHEPVSAEQMAK